MGMFDSFYDADGIEWQTKAYDCLLEVYRVGDAVPAVDGDLKTYQVEVFGGRGRPVGLTDSYATIRDGIVASINDARDPSLHLIDYHGGWLPSTEGL